LQNAVRVIPASRFMRADRTAVGASSKYHRHNVKEKNLEDFAIDKTVGKAAKRLRQL